MWTLIYVRPDGRRVEGRGTWEDCLWAYQRAELMGATMIGIRPPMMVS